MQGLLCHGQRLPVALDDLLSLAGVATRDGVLQQRQRAALGDQRAEMEEGHLHHGIDTGAELTLARDAGGIDDVETRVARIQQCLYLLRQLRPDLAGGIGGVE